MPDPRALRRAASCSAAFVAALVAWLVLDPLGLTASVLVSNVSYVLGAAAGSVCCAIGARRHRGRIRLAWHCIAAALAVWAAANVLWLWYESVRKVPIPVPSAYDAAYLLAFLLVVVGVALLVRPAMRTASPVRIVLDGLLIASSVFYVAWVTLLSGLPGLDGSAERAVTWAYPILDVALACVAVLALSRGARNGRSCWLLLAGGLLILSASDSFWAYQNLTGSFTSGAPIDAAWVAGYLMLGLAALTPGDDRRGVAVVSERWMALVPYVPFALVLVTTMTKTIGAEPDPVRNVAGLVTIALLLVRQVVAVLENQRLAREMEVRVEKRTSELAKSEALFRAVGDTISDAVVVLDESRAVRYASNGLNRIAGYGVEDLAAEGVLRLLHPDDLRQVLRLTGEVTSELGSTRVIRCRMRRADGTYGHVEITMTNFLDHPDINGHLCAIRDVSEQRDLEERLRHRAEHDDLTGLVNRSALAERLEALLAGGASPAVLLLDLDGFKALNDSLGHAIGDELLQAVAERLLAAVRPEDLVARLGGDEFAVVVDSSLEQASALAERVVTILDAPVNLGGRSLRSRASVGVTSIGASADDLLRNADLAMYEAKAHGRNRVEIFHDGMHERLLRQVSLEEALGGAIERDELRLVYQPVIGLRSGELIGAEALLRWDLDGVAVEPSEFIPIAEDSGLIREIGRWVLDRACADAVSWYRLRPDGPLPRVAVNVSVRQLADCDLVGDVIAALAESGLDGACLTVELTESAMMETSGVVIDRLTELRAIGVRVSIDDFGTGYSSLGRLKFLPVDEVKIDRSFVSVIHAEDDPAPVVDTVLALGRSLGLEIVAEGIEEIGQLRALQQRGCDAGQGFVFGAGLTSEDLERLVARAPLDLANDALNFSL